MPENPRLQTEVQAPFTFSQSSLQDYTDCARRFQLRYVVQLKWPAIESDPVLENEKSQVEGQQFHRMVQQFALGLPAEKIARMAITDNLARWWENFITATKTGLGDLGTSRLYPEVTLSAPIGKHRILAKYDLIAVKDNQATIYDWKTYHNRPKDERVAARPQTRVYRALLVMAGAHLNESQSFSASQINMQYWYSDFPTEPAKFPYDASLYKHDWEELTNIINEITNKQSYPLTDDDKKCSFCSYRSYCDRGVGAGDAEDVELDVSVEDITLEQIQEIEF